MLSEKINAKRIVNAMSVKQLEKTLSRPPIVYVRATMPVLPPSLTKLTTRLFCQPERFCASTIKRPKAKTERS